MYITARGESGTGTPAPESEAKPAEAEPSLFADAAHDVQDAAPAAPPQQSETWHSAAVQNYDQELPGSGPDIRTDTTSSAQAATEVETVVAEEEEAEMEFAPCKPEDDLLTEGDRGETVCLLWIHGDTPAGETGDPAVLAVLEKALAAGGGQPELPQRDPDYTLELPDGARFPLWQENGALLCRREDGSGFILTLTPEEMLSFFTPAV